MNTYLAAAIGALLNIKAIAFESRGGWSGIKTVSVTNTVFTDEKFTMSVMEDDWDDGPAACMATELANLVAAGELTFKPIIEEH